MTETNCTNCERGLTPDNEICETCHGLGVVETPDDPPTPVESTPPAPVFGPEHSTGS